jgi:hypothetical protein
MVFLQRELWQHLKNPKISLVKKLDPRYEVDENAANKKSKKSRC